PGLRGIVCASACGSDGDGFTRCSFGFARPSRNMRFCRPLVRPVLAGGSGKRNSAGGKLARISSEAVGERHAALARLQLGATCYRTAGCRRATVLLTSTEILSLLATRPTVPRCNPPTHRSMQQRRPCRKVIGESTSRKDYPR